MFRMMRGKAAKGCKRCVHMMFEQLQSALTPQDRKLARRQLQAEYGVDPLSEEARAAPAQSEFSDDDLSAAMGQR